MRQRCQRSAVRLGRPFAACVLAIVVAGLTSCGGGGISTSTNPPPATPVLTTVSVTLSPTSIFVGQTSAATTSGADQNGAAIGVGTVAWTTGSSAIATVTSSGTVTAVAAGQTQVIASAGGKQGQATITITVAPVASVTITPNVPAPIAAGGTANFTATTLDALGAVLTGRTITWASSNAAIATVATTGASTATVTAVAPGAVTISATSEGKTGTVSFTVLAPARVNSVSVAPATATLTIGQTTTIVATVSADAGVPTTVTWSTSDATKATVDAAGKVTAVAAAPAVAICATSTFDATKKGCASVAVTAAPVPVATVTVTPATANVVVGATQQLTATTLDANGAVLASRVVTWASSDATKATVSASGLVTAVAAGSTTITATSEGKSGTSAITVTAIQQACSSASALQLAVGQAVTLTVAQKASLCLGITGTASEYVLIPFGNSTVAASTVPVTVTATNTSAIAAPPLAAFSSSMASGLSGTPSAQGGRSPDWAFRERERRDLAQAFVRRSSIAPRNLTGVPATPTVGSIVQMNANLSGNTCSNPKTLRATRVVAVLPRTIVLIDTLAPAGGYTDAELVSFGAAFDTLGYGLDTLNFGVPSDIDGNGRVAVLFTPNVNRLPAPPGATIFGLQASRDLFLVASCVASNEGEMFYMPVPDPNQTINGSYKTKATLANAVLTTLVHEFQHLINAGRRIYVNNANSFEEVWLNEGLSHVAEELLYYQVSGNTPGLNIGLAKVRSTQAQLDAINTYQIQNLGRLLSYMQAPETNSPWSQVDALEMRGAIWQLLRYSSDRKGGLERSTWFALVNSATAGQANYNAVFGDIVSNARDWAVAQFVDDAGLPVAASYTNPSWNFRTLMPAINSNVFPLLTRALVGSPVNVSLNGGGAAYLRFGVAASVFATVTGTSSGQPLPATVDFILVRTQ